MYVPSRKSPVETRPQKPLQETTHKKKKQTQTGEKSLPKGVHGNNPGCVWKTELVFHPAAKVIEPDCDN